MWAHWRMTDLSMVSARYAMDGSMAGGVWFI
jgi:hypothetical protein